MLEGVHVDMSEEKGSSEKRYLNPRMIADTMLGEVARWLRILGYDVLYSRNYSDYQIINIARKTNRVILTRDWGLHVKARKRGIRSIYVSTDNITERLAELVLKLGIELNPDPAKSRCPECNAELIVVRDKTRVKDRVPPGAYERYSVFYLCPRCGRVYWEGGHWRNIRRIVSEARKLVEVAKSAGKAG